jgi:hypothetical protein
MRSNSAILAGLFLLLGSVIALAIGLDYGPELVQAAQWIANFLSLGRP